MSEPAKTDDHEKGRWHVYVDLLLPAVTSLRRCLAIDEDIFRSHTFRAAPRDYVLWTALDEVGKVAMYLMKLDGFLGDDPSKEVREDHWIERTSAGLVLEESRLRVRRLCEVLSQLVLFAGRDEVPYYLHFLLLEELSAAYWHNQDLKAFHGAESAWVQFGIDRIALEVATAEAGVDHANAWYASYKAPLRRAHWPRPLTSARDRILRALPTMTDFERIAMGTTYDEAFGQPSAGIHYRAGSDTRSNAGDATTILGEGSKLGMVGFCVVRRCFVSLGRPAGAPAAEQIARVLETNTAEPTRKFELLNHRLSIAVGDFVVARGYLGEVIEEMSSSLGYRSLRVELLAERPLPELAVDWFRARDVVLAFSRVGLARKLRSRLGGAVSSQDEREALRASVLAAWNAGLREQVHGQMFGRPDGSESGDDGSVGKRSAREPPQE